VRSPAFYYHFERTPSAPANGPPARHGAELPYVFGNLDPAKATNVDRQRSELMMAYWIAFATTGDPNGALPPGAESLAAAAKARPQWAPHTAAGDQTMVFSGTVELETGVRAKELAFFDDYFERLLAGP
jgi:para-nitrobenzyl esterase